MRTGEEISSWRHLLENYKVTPLAFYNTVIEVLKRREIPDIAFEKVEWCVFRPSRSPIPGGADH